MSLENTTRTVVAAILILFLTGVSVNAQPHSGPPEGVCPKKFVDVYLGFFLYDTVDCTNGETPTNYLFAYENELRASQLGCDGTSCKTGTPAPAFTMVILPLNPIDAGTETGKAEQQARATEGIAASTKAIQSLLGASSGKKSTVNKLGSINSARMNVFFDDLVLRADLYDGTTKYYCCLAAVYHRDDAIKIPVMLAIEVSEPAEGRVDGTGRLVLDVSTMKVQLNYEVEIDLGSRKTRKSLSFFVPVFN